MICSFLCGLQREIHSEQNYKRSLDSEEVEIQEALYFSLHNILKKEKYY